MQDPSLHRKKDEYNIVFFSPLGDNHYLKGCGIFFFCFGLFTAFKKVR